MKTKSRYILIILLSLICLNCQSQEIKSIRIKFVNLDIDTPFSITCENFENFFEEIIEDVLIEDKEIIIGFLRVLEGLEEAKLSRKTGPDTRIKIEIAYEDKTSSICIDRFDLYTSEGTSFPSRPMLRFLKEIIPLVGYYEID